jgi:hypothetical protein
MAKKFHNGMFPSGAGKPYNMPTEVANKPYPNQDCLDAKAENGSLEMIDAHIKGDLAKLRSQYKGK